MDNSKQLIHFNHLVNKNSNTVPYILHSCVDGKKQTNRLNKQTRNRMARTLVEDLRTPGGTIKASKTQE